MAARFTSNGSGFILTEARGGFGRCAIRFSYSPLIVLNGPKVLPAGYHVEARETSPHCPLPGCYHCSPPTHLGFDAKWEYNGVS